MLQLTPSEMSQYNLDDIIILDADYSVEDPEASTSSAINNPLTHEIGSNEAPVINNASK